MLRHGNRRSARSLVLPGSETMVLGSFITFTRKQGHSPNCLNDFLSVQPPTFAEVRAAVLSFSAFNLSAFNERIVRTDAVHMFRRTCGCQWLDIIFFPNKVKKKPKVSK